jgi:2'-5' RNA ligase
MMSTNRKHEEEDSRRLFFGAQTEAPWPKEYPPARMIPEEVRHLTLAFLGHDSFSKLKTLLSSAPLPSFLIGPAGIAKEVIFLPPERSRVAALTTDWLHSKEGLNVYQKKLGEWLVSHGYSLDQRPFFPHISVARPPFDKEEWKLAFSPLPFFVKAIHLYQSMGNLEYTSLWSCPLISPFEEFEHTADIAFHIRGMSIEELHSHAQLALAFKFPLLVNHFTSNWCDTFDEMVISLNELISLADAEFGCPFKAVSFHGTIQPGEHNILNWEMIVDV